MPQYVYIATSLDGFIATTDGGIEWLDDIPNPDQSDFGFSDFMQRVDGLLMGRKTYEKVLTLGGWPYEKPVYVLSSSEITVPSEFNGRVYGVHGDVREVLEDLAQQGIKHVYLDGGLLIQSCLREDLVDELIITRLPKLLGSGIPLFGELDFEMRFQHLETEVIHNYLVKSRYRRERI